MALLLLAIPSAAGVDSFAVHKVSETSSTITLGWSPQPGFGYLFTADGVLRSRTYDPNRSTVQFSKQYSSFDIDVIVKGPNGHYPPVTPPPPPKNQCEDLVDNDGDSLIDYPADPGCLGLTDNDESNPPPGPVGFPNATNTGVLPGSTLTPYTGPQTITQAGTVIANKTLGCIRIEAGGVIIRNSRLTCNPGGTAVIYSNNDTGARTLIEDVEINCLNGANSAGIGNRNYTIRRVDIFNCENGANVHRNFDIRDSYIHDGYNDGDSHMDGMQFTAAANDVQIIHNTILGVGNNGRRGTSSLIADLPGHSNWLIENNLFGGGAYTVYCVDGKGTNWIIRNNRFALAYGRNGTSGEFGFATECGDETQSGNVIHETDAPIFLG